MGKTYNDLVYAIAKRVKELGNYKIDDLRSIAGYGCETHSEAIRVHRYENRGSLLEIIITEEFAEENDREWDNA